MLILRIKSRVSPSRVCVRFISVDLPFGRKADNPRRMKQVQRLLFAVAASWQRSPADLVLWRRCHPEFIALGLFASIQRGSLQASPGDKGPAPAYAFVHGHRTANFLNHIGCRDNCPAAGFLALCFKQIFLNIESQDALGGDAARM
jgi:hypothetical protein